jgi:hypothetical protein
MAFSPPVLKSSRGGPNVHPASKTFGVLFFDIKLSEGRFCFRERDPPAPMSIGVPGRRVRRHARVSRRRHILFGKRQTDTSVVCSEVFCVWAALENLCSSMSIRGQKHKFPNEPILKIRKSLSINNQYQKTNFRIAKSKPKHLGCLTMM